MRFFAADVHARASLGVVIADIWQPIQKTPLKSTLQKCRKWRVCNIEKYPLKKQLIFERTSLYSEH
jgi:hypothetical protein